ncbi:hypothetical protein AN958_05236 [Leucoagaricus sp. SymC.cos]|nr:hypothetical protein AN958_05236 [Leucoagaricus sp. SymC.cos]
MSAATTPSSTAALSTPSSTDPNLNPESCISLASSLRCYYTNEREIHHTLLIIPVALELIFSTSLVFTNWRAGRRHLLLVAEGWVIFLLSLIEVLLHVVSAVRTHVATFRAIDQSIGALSFIQLFFYMSFLYVWVRRECFPIVPSRLRRIARSLLLIFIPAVIAMNTIASFVGVSYDMGHNHPVVTFRDARARFVWPFFSSATLALFVVFQASCFFFAFYRLMRAILTQRKFEVSSKDAAVLFRGIGWINIGIKVGAIETVVGFVLFGGVPIAYVRRTLRMFSRAFICIGVAKGADGTEDFKAIRDELESMSSDKTFRRSRLRQLISNPRLSTFRQLSPTATAFHATPRAPAINYDLSQSNNEKPHPYAASAFLTSERAQPTAGRNSIYAQSPVYEKSGLPGPASVSKGFSTSPKPTTTTGLPGMAEFAEVRAKRMSQHSQKRVTVCYHHGTPTLHLRLSHIELPSPAVIAQSIKGQPNDNHISEYRNSFMQTPKSQFKERSRFSATSVESDVDDAPSIYPASTTHGHTVDGENVYRTGPNPYGYFTSSPSTKSEDLSPHTFGKNHLPAAFTSAAHDHTSDISAAHAEIVDMPRRQLSFSRQKSALARAVLYPLPGTEVAMALSGKEENPSPSSTSPPPRRLQKPRPNSLPKSNKISYPTLLLSQRPLPSPSPVPVRQEPLPAPEPIVHPTQQHRASFVRESIIDDDGNVITVTAIAPSIDEEEYDSEGRPKRNTRALSGYSVGSVPETLQAVRELAKKFPSLPPGAVVVSTISDQSYIHVEDAASSVGHTKVSVESTDTEEIIRGRIPAEAKMKQKMVSGAPVMPPPPPPNPQKVQQLPPSIPPRNPRRLQRPMPRPFEKAPPPEAQFTAKPIDPFDDDDATSYRETMADLSPLSMSVKLRHPQSFISSMYAPTMALTSPVTPSSPAYYQQPGQAPSTLGHGRNRSQEGTMSPGVLDFGTALKEGQNMHARRPMSNLPSIEMIEGHRRSLSAQTRVELDRQQQRQRRPDSLASYDIDISDELPDQLQQLRQTSNAPGGPLNRIKSIGKAPRRITPQPTRGHHVRGSMHLQPLVIPVSSSGRDVPISAVGAGGIHTILGVNKAGMNVNVAQEPDDSEAVLSATTEGATSNGRGIVRYSEALSIEDGGYVPIRLQGSRKGSF